LLYLRFDSLKKILSAKRLVLTNRETLVMLVKIILNLIRLIAKRVIPTYINYSRPLIPHKNHIMFERCVRVERNQYYPYKLTLCEKACGIIVVTSLV